MLATACRHMLLSRLVLEYEYGYGLRLVVNSNSEGLPASLRRVRAHDLEHALHQSPLKRVRKDQPGTPGRDRAAAASPPRLLPSLSRPPAADEGEA